LVYVPEGEFKMGDNEGSGKGDEEPMHTVLLDSFWIDQTEVTNAMFATFLNELGNQSEGGSNWYDNRGEYVYIEPGGGSWVPWVAYQNHPVNHVTWYGAQAYCAWADGSRLPTEAEWEKAARSTDERDYPWGDTAPNLTLACYRSCCRSLHFGSCVHQMTEVGLYPEGASLYGVYDMAGNVNEWIYDWYDKTYYSLSPLTNPTGPDSGTDRGIRGGSWYFSGEVIRSAYRNRYHPAYAWFDIGFRCVHPQP